VGRDRNRQTFSIPTSISAALIEQVKADAERSGYHTLRAYLEALIAQGLISEEDHEPGAAPDEQTQTLAAAYPSSAWAFGPAILASRVVLAIDALTERIQTGEDVEALRADLMSVRREIVEHLMGLRADYDREVEARDRRHYGRLGGVE
jgi:hypothetical protein